MPILNDLRGEAFVTVFYANIKGKKKKRKKSTGYQHFVSFSRTFSILSSGKVYKLEHIQFIVCKYCNFGQGIFLPSCRSKRSSIKRFYGGVNPVVFE